MAEILVLRPKHPRSIGVCLNEITGHFRVYAWPPCPDGNLDQEFPDSDGAVTYALQLAHEHKFSIHSPMIPDALWAELVQDSMEAM